MRWCRTLATLLSTAMAAAPSCPRLWRTASRSRSNSTAEVRAAPVAVWVLTARKDCSPATSPGPRMTTGSAPSPLSRVISTRPSAMTVAPWRGSPWVKRRVPAGTSRRRAALAIRPRSASDSPEKISQRRRTDVMASIKDLRPDPSLRPCYRGPSAIRSRIPALEHEGGVDAAEGEIVGNETSRVQVAMRELEVIQVGAAGIGLDQVQGGGDAPGPGHLDAHPGFEGAARAQGVAHVALEGGDGHALLEDLAGGVALGDVAVLGGGAVGVDPADGIGREAGIGQGQAHGLGHGGLLGLGDVGAVGVGPEAQDLRVDAGPAGQGVVPVLEDEGAAALAHH